MVGGRAGDERSRNPFLAMGHNDSWISRNASEPRNASGAEAGGANRSALGEFGEAQLYRQFTTTVQVVIFIGSLLGKPPAGAPPGWASPSEQARRGHGIGGRRSRGVPGKVERVGFKNAGVAAGKLSRDGRLQPPSWKRKSSRRALSRSEDRAWYRRRSASRAALAECFGMGTTLPKIIPHLLCARSERWPELLFINSEEQRCCFVADD